MPIFNLNISTINKFINKFKPCFSKKQFFVFSFFIYALFKDYKRNSLYAMASKTSIKYQNFQYFFSDSKWSTSQLNDIRVKIIQSQSTTSSSMSGNIALDDTASPKPFAKATQGAHFQYCAPLKTKEVCNVTVFSAFCSKTKHFPVNFKSYLPEDEFFMGKDDPDFKSKLDLAEELIDDAVEKKINFSYILMDAWYAGSSNLLEHIHSAKHLSFIGELKSNRNILFFHPVKRKHCFLKQDELVKLIKKHYPHKCKFHTYTASDGKKKSLLTYTFKSSLKDCSVPLKLVVILGKWSDEDDKTAHILISNQTAAYTHTIISNYFMRWGIELIFRELKDVFCFDQYQLRHKEKIERYWALCLLAWTLVYWLKQNAYLSKVIQIPLSTFNDYKQAINSLILYDSNSTLSKNKLLRDECFNIKSNRFKLRIARAA